MRNEHLDNQRVNYSQSVDIQNQDEKQQTNIQTAETDNLDPFMVLHKSQNFRRQFQTTLDQINNDESVNVGAHEMSKQSIGQEKEDLPLQMRNIGTGLQDDFLKGYNMAISSSKDNLNQDY